MIVRMLRNPSKSLDCSLLEGQEGEVSGTLGAKLVALKIAVDITPVEAPKVVEAVPAEPALSGVTETSTPVSKKRQ